MDIGRFKNNTEYYEGYEEEPELILTLKGLESNTLHIWEGYFDDIFSDPQKSNDIWFGFTRDYQECTGAWGDTAFAEIKCPKEYLEDIQSYEEHNFEYEESEGVKELIMQFLQFAVTNKYTVMMYIK